MDWANQVRESNHNGFLRSANVATNTIWSEETNRVRTPNANLSSPMQYAREWAQVFYAKNDILGQMYSWGTALDNIKILRPNYANKPRLMELPNREGFRRFDNLPNVNYDRTFSDVPMDNRLQYYRDPFGTAGTPTKGHSNIILSELYNGNPWGAGGRDFIAVGNQHRDPKFNQNRPRSCLKTGHPGHPLNKMKQRVKWQK
jgi:hypothetical protein